MSNKNLLNLLLPENPVVTNEGVSSLVAEKKTNHCLSLLSIVWVLGNRTDWLLGLGELLHALLLQWINTITYNNGIKNIFHDEDQRWCFLFKDVGYLNSTYLVMTDCEKHEKMSLFNQVLTQIAMVTIVTLIFWLLRRL